ncbi:MAG: DNA primase [Proteobacteria bacterium]|nr:DNA primase [Pseudomonadota bacterium]
MAFYESRDDVAAQIKERADIVQIIGECVELKRSGVRFLGRCPFHGEKTPSFSVHSGQQFYHCFGCGESGDVFSFMMKYHNFDFPTALKELAKRYQIELPERRRSKEDEQRIQRSEQLFTVNEKCATIFSRYLQDAPGAGIARAYLIKRGVSPELLARFRIGYAPAVEEAGWNFLGGQLGKEEMKAAVEAGLLVEKEQSGSYDRFRDRILFPISDISGRICGFGGRIVGEGQPKYLNSPESLVFNKGKLLLGLFQQKEYIRRQNHAVLVEGNFDLISLVAHGCNNVVAPLGTALTREQLRLLKRFAEKVTLLFDGDDAGRKAAVRAVPLFLAEQIPGRVAFLPTGHDPDTFIREKGLAEVDTLLEQAVALPEFALDQMTERHGLTLDGKSKILGELKPLIAAAASPLQRALFVSHFAEKLGLTVDQLDANFERASELPTEPQSRPVKKVKTEQVGPLAMAQRQLVEFMILQPRYFFKLAEAGLRNCLAGGIGEMLFLELECLLTANPQAEPEELLTVLAEGAERSLVAELLLRTPVHSSKEDENSSDNEIADLLEYLQKFQLKKQSDELMQRIELAEKTGDHYILQELMAEQVKITRKLHGQIL